MIYSRRITAILTRFALRTARHRPLRHVHFVDRQIDDLPHWRVLREVSRIDGHSRSPPGMASGIEVQEGKLHDALRASVSGLRAAKAGRMSRLARLCLGAVFVLILASACRTGGPFAPTGAHPDAGAPAPTRIGWLQAGQSNAYQCTRGVAAAVPGARAWNAEAGAWQLLADPIPLGPPRANWPFCETGWLPFLAQAMTARGYAFDVAGWAVPAANIRVYDEGEDAWVRLAAAAAALGPRATHFAVWIGEANAGDDDLDVFAVRLDSLVRRVRTLVPSVRQVVLFGLADAPRRADVVTALPGLADRYAQVRAILRDYAARHPDTAYVSTEGVSLEPEEFHPDLAGAREIGAVRLPALLR